MNIIEDFKKALGIMRHPSSVKTPMSMLDALSFYYGASIIPLIAVIVVGLVLSFAIGAGLLLLTYLVLPVLELLVIVPIGIIVDAALYQLFAVRLFKVWHKPYNNTLTATTFAVFPSIMLLWGYNIPVVGSAFSIVAAIWAFIILIISMANMQQVSGLRAFGGLLLTGVIIGIIVLLVFLAGIASFGALLHGVSPIGAPI
ncbi:MAG: hypothetical protein M1360_04820 [Candidatus Marsarchaeota archaeon]|jgi:hypothetical protein|nr:hypothetical protein [Candidatus Marsarchaeota archaeon]MCL5419227.1 hypothetical protein [Candidatus Marsarchaeota archaeon]